MPVNDSASAADGSSSSGTRSPAIETDSESQRRHRHLDPRRDQISPGLRAIDGPGGGAKRRAKTRPAVPHGQAVHLQLPDRDEVEHLTVADSQSGGIERHLEPPEGQGKRAALRDEVRPFGRAEAQNERPVIQIRCGPKPRVEPTHGSIGGLLVGEEEGVGVNGRRQEVLFLLGRLAVQERQLREGEELVLVSLRGDHRPVQLGNGGLGTLAEGFEETALVEHVAGRQTRLARRDGALVQLAKDDLGVDPGRVDRVRAGRQGEHRQAEGESSGAQGGRAHLSSLRTPDRAIPRLVRWSRRTRTYGGAPTAGL
jgi:hypothetical protein